MIRSITVFPTRNPEAYFKTLYPIVPRKIFTSLLLLLLLLIFLNFTRQGFLKNATL